MCAAGLVGFDGIPLRDGGSRPGRGDMSCWAAAAALCARIPDIGTTNVDAGHSQNDHRRNVLSIVRPLYVQVL